MPSIFLPYAHDLHKKKKKKGKSKGSNFTKKIKKNKIYIPKLVFFWRSTELKFYFGSSNGTLNFCSLHRYNFLKPCSSFDILIS